MNECFKMCKIQEMDIVEQFDNIKPYVQLLIEKSGKYDEIFEKMQTFHKDNYVLLKSMCIKNQELSKIPKYTSRDVNLFNPHTPQTLVPVYGGEKFSIEEKLTVLMFLFYGKILFDTHFFYKYVHHTKSKQNSLKGGSIVKDDFAVHSDERRQIMGFKYFNEKTKELTDAFVVKASVNKDYATRFYEKEIEVYESLYDPAKEKEFGPISNVVQFYKPETSYYTNYVKTRRLPFVSASRKQFLVDLPHAKCYMDVSEHVKICRNIKRKLQIATRVKCKAIK